jgi:predicted PurR-regulated permease PerM
MKAEWSTTARSFTLVLVIAFLVFVGYQLRGLLRPLIFAGVVAYLFYPLVAFAQNRFKLSRRTASRIVFFLSLAIIIILLVVLVPILVRQTAEITEDLQQTIADAQQFLSTPINIGGFPIDLGGIIGQYKGSISTSITTMQQNPVSVIRNASRNFLWTLIIFGAIYLFMTEWETIRENLIRVAPEADRPDLTRLYSQIRQVWLAYLRGQLTLMGIVAVTFAVVWTLIGLPGSLYLGLLAGLLSIVPDIGAFAVTVLAFTIALLRGSSWLPVSHLVFGLIVIGLYALLINIQTIWLRPYIFGRSVHINEAVVFVAIIAAVIFTGILGAFIVVPVLASIVVIWNYLHARMLGSPPFQDEVPAAPVPDVVQGGKPASDSEPVHPGG